MYKAGAYIRLSREDGNKFEESNSIKNQREIIKEYLKNHEDITIYDYYSDDGKTGTNFERPGFQNMIKDMYDKKIDCIIVKDLSRFGRNYIEVGRYIEYIFPSNNIRFISINDNIDNVANPDSINNVIVPFKNMMNDEYSRDISRKVKKAREIKRLNGELTSGHAPYGYIIKNKNFIIDNNVKDVVKTIFDFAYNGETCSQIAAKLNEEKIDSPAVYKEKQRKKKNYKITYWCSSYINSMLRNSSYIGDLIQGKATTLSHKVRKPISIPKEKWIITKNHHEPIIDEEIFNQVQEIIDSRYTNKNVSRNKNEFKTIYRGYLKCYDCNKSLVKTACNQKNDKTYIAYECYTYLKISHDLCNKKYIKYEELSDKVFKILKSDINFFINFEENILPNITSKEKLQAINIKEEELTNKLTDINKLKNETLYDLKKELITKEDYEFYTSSYNKSIKEANKELNELKEEKFVLTHEERTVKEFIKSFKKYRNIKELNENILKELIDTIYVKADKSIKLKYLDEDIYNLIKEKIEDGQKKIYN